MTIKRPTFIAHTPRRLFLVSCFVVGACQQHPRTVQLVEPFQRYRAEDYQRVLRKWTRSRELVKLLELNTPLRMHVTLRSADYNSAYIAKYCSMFTLPPQECSKLARELRQREKKFYSFVVASATHDLNWNDLDEKDSHWRATLINNHGDMIIPTAIKKVRRLTATEQVLYPHLGPFYSLFFVDFPKDLANGTPLIRPGVNKIVFRLAGALGQAEVAWRFE